MITRNMAPLCGSLVSLLRACDQVPEANLVKLVEEFEGGTMHPEAEAEAGEEDCGEEDREGEGGDEEGGGEEGIHPKNEKGNKSLKGENFKSVSRKNGRRNGEEPSRKKQRKP